jgi:hypothetical protein
VPYMEMKIQYNATVTITAYCRCARCSAVGPSYQRGSCYTADRLREDEGGAGVMAGHTVTVDSFLDFLPSVHFFRFDLSCASS